MNIKAVIAEFDDDTQELLKELDMACGVQMESLRKEAASKSLANEELQINTETMVWLRFIKGFGILYNRAIDSGWITGVMTNDK